MPAQYFICSDVHLGISHSDRKSFEDFLGLPQDGDTLVLLGDILDFWISNEGPADQLKTFVQYWKVLYNLLGALKKRGVRIFYVPGNHDSIVFYGECAANRRPYWGDLLREYCATYRDLVMDTAGYRFPEICEIHYPFLLQNVGTRKFLFTHGHWTQFFWKLFGQDLATTSRPQFWPILKGIANCITHENAGLIRRLFLKYYPNADDFELAKRTQDLGYCIVARHLKNSTAKTVFHKDGPAREPSFRDVGEVANGLREQMDDQSSLEALYQLGCKAEGDKLLEQWSKNEPPEEQIDPVAIALSFGDAKNYRLFNDKSIQVEDVSISTFQGFQYLVFGHFHKPRSNDKATDTGCMLIVNTTRIATYLRIESDGTVRPEF